MSRGDARIYGEAGVTTVPSGKTDWTEAQITNLAAGQAATFQVATFPDDEQLALWNFLLSIYVDIPGEGGGGGINLLRDLQYIFPAPYAGTGSTGVQSALTAAQRSLTLMQWVDWAQSSDLSNIRVHNIRLRNEDSNPHTYLLRYKAYTISRAAGN